MAEMTCTIEEFHKFIGPRIRNSIQSLTKRKKKELGYICQMCDKKRELEAAHIRGRDRKSVIESVLMEYLIDGDDKRIRVDLDEVEGRIMSDHKPIDRYFKFLCATCHVEYDSIPRNVLGSELLSASN